MLSHQHPPNIPGKSLITGFVTMPPNAASPPHTHGGAAVVGLTVSGAVLNQMNESEPFISKPGNIWYEAPGCHHVRSENVGEGDEVRFFAVFVVDDEIVKDGYEGLVVVDKQKEDEE